MASFGSTISYQIRTWSNQSLSSSWESIERRRPRDAISPKHECNDKIRYERVGRPSTLYKPNQPFVRKHDSASAKEESMECAFTGFDDRGGGVLG